MPYVDTTKKVHFQSQTKDAFLADVRQRVDEYFTAKKIPKTANRILHLKSLFLISLCVLLYLTLLNGWVPEIPRIFIWMVLGVNQAFIALNIGHDALHSAYSETPWINRFLGYLAYDCVGLSSYVWKQTHNKEHHTYTNIAGVDPDIHKPGILRFSPHDPYHSFYAYQHLYSWILYSFATLNWVFFADLTYAWTHRKEFPKSEFYLLHFFKVLNFSYMILLPLALSPMAWWEVLVGYTAAQLSAGLSVAVIFQLAHVVENVSFPLPDEQGVIAKNWSAHEMATTCNFATDNPILTHIIGGLNFQVEHHLLPKISHGHYFELSKIVRKTAEEHRLPYHENPTMGAAIRSHANLLKRLGKGN